LRGVAELKAFSTKEELLLVQAQAEEQHHAQQTVAAQQLLEERQLEQAAQLLTELTARYPWDRQITQWQAQCKQNQARVDDIRMEIQQSQRAKDLAAEVMAWVKLNTLVPDPQAMQRLIVARKAWRAQRLRRITWGTMGAIAAGVLLVFGIMYYNDQCCLAKAQNLLGQKQFDPALAQLDDCGWFCGPRRDSLREQVYQARRENALDQTEADIRAGRLDDFRKNWPQLVSYSVGRPHPLLPKERLSLLNKLMGQIERSVLAGQQADAQNWLDETQKVDQGAAGMAIPTVMAALEGNLLSAAQVRVNAGKADQAANLLQLANNLGLAVQPKLDEVKGIIAIQQVQLRCDQAQTKATEARAGAEKFLRWLCNPVIGRQPPVHSMPVQPWQPRKTLPRLKHSSKKPNASSPKPSRLLSKNPEVLEKERKATINNALSSLQAAMSAKRYRCRQAALSALQKADPAYPDLPTWPATTRGFTDSVISCC